MGVRLFPLGLLFSPHLFVESVAVQINKMMPRTRTKRPPTEMDPNIETEGVPAKRLAAVLEQRKSEKNVTAQASSYDA